MCINFNMENQRTVISIHRDTRKKIDELKYRDNESYDSVIMRMVQMLEYVRTIK